VHRTLELRHFYQRAEPSTDGGKNWQMYFNGHYVRRKN
jgi:hypothetical protein